MFPETLITILTSLKAGAGERPVFERRVSLRQHVRAHLPEIQSTSLFCFNLLTMLINFYPGDAAASSPFFTCKEHFSYPIPSRERMAMGASNSAYSTSRVWPYGLPTMPAILWLTSACGVFLLGRTHKLPMLEPHGIDERREVHDCEDREHHNVFDHSNTQ